MDNLNLLDNGVLVYRRILNKGYSFDRSETFLSILIGENFYPFIRGGGKVLSI